MKPPLVLGSIIGGVALIGASAVGMTYFALHAVSPPPAAPRPVAEATLPATGAPAAAQEPPLPGPVRARPNHAHRRLCPVPAVYHPRRRPRFVQPTHLRMAQSGYPPPPPMYAPPVQPYASPYWRAGWRGPGWRYPPRWAYGPRPGYGPGWRDW